MNIDSVRHWVVLVLSIVFGAWGSGAHAASPVDVAAGPSTGTRVFVHPGLLHSQADLDRMKAKVASGAHPWIDGWNVLIANSHAQLRYRPNPQPIIYRGKDGKHSENYDILYNDVAAAYQCALRYKVSGDTAYADKSVAILNAWGSTLTAVGGWTEASLATGIYGYELANAAEIMRDYKGWDRADFARFQNMMVSVFYAGNHDFLVRRHGTKPSHYWANWDLCAMASMISVGVLCDRPDIYDEAVTYFKMGVGNGNIDHAVYYMFPGYLGQWQESGRDQGHSTLGVSLIGAFCEAAWHQGDDLYGYENNRVLAGMEYIAKYNLGNDVPFVTYANSDTVQTTVSTAGRGDIRPDWELVYNHYVNIKGIAAPYTEQCAAKARPEGGGGNYGPNSGGYDQVGFGTLTATLDPLTTPLPPSGLTALVSGNNVTLSWWGSVGVTEYAVRRATAAAGPYSTIATVKENTYLDTTAASSGANYYKVVAVTQSGKTLVSNQAVASLTPTLDASFQPVKTVLVGGASLTQGEHGSTICLNGSDQYASLPDGLLTGLSDCTFSAWVKPAGTAKWSRVFDFGSGTVSYVFLTTQNQDGKLQFSITGSGGTGEERIIAPSSVPIDTWSHVAVTLRDGVGSLYIDGVVVARTPLMHWTPGQLGLTMHNYIGKSQFPDPYFEGQVADFGLYNGALSASQVAQLASRR